MQTEVACWQQMHKSGNTNPDSKTTQTGKALYNIYTVYTAYKHYTRRAAAVVSTNGRPRAATGVCRCCAEEEEETYPARFSINRLMGR